MRAYFTAMILGIQVKWPQRNDKKLIFTLKKSRFDSTGKFGQLRHLADNIVMNQVAKRQPVVNRRNHDKIETDSPPPPLIESWTF